MNRMELVQLAGKLEKLGFVRQTAVVTATSSVIKLAAKSITVKLCYKDNRIQAELTRPYKKGHRVDIVRKPDVNKLYVGILVKLVESKMKLPNDVILSIAS